MTDVFSLESYDDLPYDSRPIAYTHVESLASRGLAYGLKPPDPAHCRVLELGCASGGNLIPQAITHPNTHFTGLDLSVEQVRAGQARIKKLGLSNLVLEHGDIMAMPDSIGPFDYIIVHGVFSWVPQGVREKILRVCQHALSTNGVAFISYNCLPGFHIRAITREILLHRIQATQSPRDRLTKARQVLEEMAAFLSGRTDPNSQALMTEVRHLQQARDSYLYHEYLETENQPFSFGAFHTLVEQHGLSFLGEADLSSLDLASPALGQTLAAAGSNPVDVEQWFDGLTMRPFRQSLLCRKDVPRERSLSALSELYWQGELIRDDTDPAGCSWSSAEGKSLNVTDPLLTQVLERLAVAFPGALQLSKLLDELDDKLEASTLLSWLVALWQAGLLRALTAAPAFAGEVRTSLAPLAELELAEGQDFLSSLATHAPLELDEFSTSLLRTLPVANDFGALVTLVDTSLQQSSEVLARIGLTGMPVDRRRAMIAANAERLLNLFARHGVLAGS